MAAPRRCFVALALLALTALAERSADTDALAGALALDAQEPGGEEEPEARGAGDDEAPPRRLDREAPPEEPGAERGEALAQQHAASGGAEEGAHASGAWAPDPDDEAAADETAADEEDAAEEKRFAEATRGGAAATRSGGFDFPQAFAGLASACGAGAGDAKCADEVLKVAGSAFAAMLSTDREEFTADEAERFRKRFAGWVRIITAKVVKEGASTAQYLKWAMLIYRGFKYQRPAITKQLVEEINRVKPGWTARYSVDMAGESWNTVVHRMGLDLSGAPADSLLEEDSRQTCWGDFGEGRLVQDEGGDVGQPMRGKSAEQCKEHCAGMEACKSFTYTPEWGRVCYFKDMVVTSGSPTASKGHGYTTYYKKDCAGSGGGSTTSLSPIVPGDGSTSAKPDDGSDDAASTTAKPDGGPEDAPKHACWGDFGQGRMLQNVGWRVPGVWRRKSVEQCKEHCASMEACKSFSHFPPYGGVCYFYSTACTPDSPTKYVGRGAMWYYKKDWTQDCEGSGGASTTVKPDGGSEETTPVVTTPPTPAPPTPAPVERFDAREHWPLCRGVLSHVRRQDCGNCWSHAQALVTEGRLCIATGGRLNGTDAWLSQSYIAMCRVDGRDYCSGGGMDEGDRTVRVRGLPTGGPDHRGNAPPGINTCVPQVKGKQKGVTCPTACTHEGYQRDLKEDLFIVKYRGAVHVHWQKKKSMQQWFFDSLKKALLDQGPVVLGFQVYRDFSSYKSGIYSPAMVKENKKLGGHAVTGMGFGPGYVLCVNSWGTRFGMGGSFMLAIGHVQVAALPAKVEDKPTYPLPVP